MKIPKYLIHLILPVPFVVVITYYASHQIVSYIESFFIERGKASYGFPDFQFQEARLDRKIFEMLALIELKERKGGLVETSMTQEVQKASEKPPKYKVQFVFLGKKKYAIINGRLLREGDPISPEEKIVKITKKGVLLSGRWGKRWIYLIE